MTAVALRSDFQTQLSNARAMAPKLLQLTGPAGLTNHELDVATNAICLSIHVAFERFVRELFYLCALQGSGLPSVRSRVGALGDSAVNDLVLGGRSYVEWLPLSNTLNRSLVFLHLGQPFIRLWHRDQILGHLDRLHTVRNRLAHSGEKAEADYEKHISRGQAAFAEPARWLQYQKPGQPKSNLVLVLDAMEKAADALVAPDRTPVNLGDATVTGGTKAAPGKYTCQTCGLTRHTREWNPLGSCTRCSPTAPAATCPTCGRQHQTPGKWILRQLKAS